MGILVRTRSLVLVGCVAAGALTACTSASKPKADDTTYPPATMSSTIASSTSVPAPAPATVAPSTTSIPSRTTSAAVSSRITSTPSTSAETTTATRRAKPTVPIVPADVPRTGPNVTGPSERPPVMPTEATKRTTAGAEAFSRFFIKTIDWGYATTNSKYMRHYFESSCTLCVKISSDIDATAAAGHHYLGDRLHILDVKRSAGAKPFSTAVVMNVDAFTSVDRTGDIKQAQPPVAALTLRCTPTWTTAGWKISTVVRLK